MGQSMKTRRIKWNKELYSLHDDIPISSYIKLQRLKWFGHLNRMEENKQMYRIYRSAPFKARPRGRPKDKWRDRVLENMREVKIRFVTDRKE